MVRLPLQRTDRTSPEVVKQARELAKAGKYEEAKQVMEKKLEEAEDVQVYLPWRSASGFCGGVIMVLMESTSCRCFARFRYSSDRL